MKMGSLVLRDPTHLGKWSLTSMKPVENINHPYPDHRKPRTLIITNRGKGRVSTRPLWRQFIPLLFPPTLTLEGRAQEGSRGGVREGPPCPIILQFSLGLVGGSGNGEL